MPSGHRLPKDGEQNVTPEEKIFYSGIVAVAAVWFWLWSIVDSALGDRARFRAGPKGLWVAVCTMVPVVGGAVYLVVGRSFLRAAGESGLGE